MQKISDKGLRTELGRANKSNLEDRQRSSCWVSQGVSEDSELIHLLSNKFD